MGNQMFEKGIRANVKQEFESLLAGKQREYVTVSEIIKFQHPEFYPFSFGHLGNLFVLNSSRSGVFTLAELYSFAEFCQKNLKAIKTYEFQSQLQAATTQVLLQHLQRQEGESEIVEWVERMLLKNEKTPVTFERMGQTQFIRIQTVKILYEIFNVKLMSGMEIQTFFYLLQQCGEEAGLMAPDAKELDEYAPSEMGKEFARQYLRGFAKLMREVGFSEDYLSNEGLLAQHTGFNDARQNENLLHGTIERSTLKLNGGGEGEFCVSDDDSEDDEEEEIELIADDLDIHGNFVSKKFTDDEVRRVAFGGVVQPHLPVSSSSYNDNYYLRQGGGVVSNNKSSSSQHSSEDGVERRETEKKNKIYIANTSANNTTIRPTFTIPLLPINLISKPGGHLATNNYMS